MQSFKASSGPFEIQLRFSPDEIDEMCAEALGKAGCMPKMPEPVRIDRFIEKHFSPNVSYEDLGPGILGYTAFNKDGSIRGVGVSSRLEDGRPSSERRLRSTLAHEAGHCLLHPILFMQGDGQAHLNVAGSANVSRADGRFLCRDSDVDPGTGRQQVRRYDGRWWEWQANRAIGGFLLPKSLVAASVEPFLKRSLVTSSPSLPAAVRDVAERNVAITFEVNPVVARIRLSEMFPDHKGQQIEF